MTKTSSGEGLPSKNRLESESTREESAHRLGAIRVVIASERWIIAEGMRHALRASKIEVAAVCKDLATTLGYISNYPPDVLVVDAGALGELAKAILSGIRSLNLPTRSIALLDRIDTLELLRATSLGVSGVVSMKAAARDLLSCVRAVASGVVWIQSESSQFAAAAANVAPIAGTPGFDALTAQQRKIAGLVAMGMRNKDIANELAISEGTVKVHVHTIFARLGLTSRAELGNTMRHPWLMNSNKGRAVPYKRERFPRTNPMSGRE